MQMRRSGKSGGGSSGGGGTREGRLVLLALIPLILIFGMVGFLICRREQAREEARKDWQMVAEGVVDRVEYGQYKEDRRVGAGPVKHTETFIMDVTAIYFQDGRSYVANGRHDMPFPHGSKVKIWRNGLDEYRLEKVE